MYENRITPLIQYCNTRDSRREARILEYSTSWYYWILNSIANTGTYTRTRVLEWHAPGTPDSIMTMDDWSTCMVSGIATVSKYTRSSYCLRTRVHVYVLEYVLHVPVFHVCMDCNTGKTIDNSWQLAVVDSQLTLMYLLARVLAYVEHTYSEYVLLQYYSTNYPGTSYGPSTHPPKNYDSLHPRSHTTTGYM